MGLLHLFATDPFLRLFLVLQQVRPVLRQPFLNDNFSQLRNAPFLLFCNGRKNSFCGLIRTISDIFRLFHNQSPVYMVYLFR